LKSIRIADNTLVGQSKDPQQGEHVYQLHDVRRVEKREPSPIKVFLAFIGLIFAGMVGKVMYDNRN
jgi:hypothetical protein